MKTIKKLLALIMIFGSLSLSSLTASAGYKYHVTVYAGSHGTITYQGESGLDKVELDVEPGQLFNPNVFEVVPKKNSEDDPDYVFICFQISGIEERSSLAAMPINEDMTFVATYGVKSKLIEFKVYYQDEDGNELRGYKTYHGHAGERPVVAFEYIDGYMPTAFNLAGITLSDDPNADNSFTFIYKPVEAVPEIIIIWDEVIYYINNPTTPGVSDTTKPSEPTKPEEEPVVIIDDNPTPQTDPDPGPDKPDPNPNPDPQPEKTDFFSSPLFYGGIGGIFLLLLLLLLGKRRKKNEQG